MLEKVLQALSTMIVGMGIVFAVLILICLIIYCFKIVPYFENKAANKKASRKKEEIVQPVVAGIPVENAGISTQEIAVIAAAIEAYTGMSQSDFVVRRIVRRS